MTEAGSGYVQVAGKWASNESEGQTKDSWDIKEALALIGGKILLLP